MNPVIFKPVPEPQRVEIEAPSALQFKKFKREFVRSYRMHRIVALTVAAVVSFLLLVYGLMRGPYYESFSLIYVQPEKARLIADVPGGGAETYDSKSDSKRYDTYIQQQLQTVVRSDILADALKSLKPDPWTLPGESEQAAIDRLRSNLKVEREKGSYQLSITLGGGNPQVIASIVNAVTNAYVRKERLDELAMTQQQLEVFQKDQKRIQGELASVRDAQAGLSSTLGIADTAGQGNPYDAQLGEVRTQLATARAANAVAQAHLSSLANRRSDSAAELDAAADELIATDKGLAALKESVSTRRARLVSEMAGLTQKNPLYKQDEEELQRLDQSQEDMTKQLRSRAASQLQERLKLEAARTSDVVGRLQGQLAQQTSVATGATTKLQKASDLAAQVIRLQAQLTQVESAISALQLENQSSGLVHLLLPAEVPLKPRPSKKIIILVGALPVGMMLGLLAAWVKHKLDPRVYIGEDVEKTLGFPPMAVLPVPDEVNGRVLDEFMLRFVGGLDQAHSISGARTYVFTAASQRVNISELVARLAVRMDRIGYRTMILSASSALQKLSLAPDFEEDESTWESSPISDMNMKPRDPRPAKVGESQLMRRRESFVAENLERLKQNVDLLFIEALPLCSSTEAEFAARLADVTILIAESATTTRDELTKTMTVMKRLNVPGVATALNDIQLRHADDDFVSIVHHVEGRQVERHLRRELSSHHVEKYTVDYGDEESDEVSDSHASSQTASDGR